MQPNSELWVIVLAAGAGRRLRAIACDAAGRAVPKQFCALWGGASLLQQSLERAARLAPLPRVITVVAREHRRWWERETASLAPESILVQPRNCGTAPGLLLPLSWALSRSVDPYLVVLPSDHFIAREDLFLDAVRRAVAASARSAGSLVLLGMPPRQPEPGLGWILPETAARGAVRRVAGFVEKPDPELARGLMGAGALWNSFVFAARGRSLLSLFERTLPQLSERFRPLLAASGWQAGTVARLYEALPVHDFSRSVLERQVEALRVLAAPACGWMDLGTPGRVEQCIREHGARAPRASCLPAPARRPPVDLSRARAPGTPRGSAHSRAGGSPFRGAAG